ncbi:MAG: hypothetical protein JO225_03135 [Candidatus Eremiobacteraeota bacterium]|nr:hypothetical protein [Candidatus Eremiobacteraeota bacterium]MBV8642889.1 hypothetical protein [Candidatus Eremiobacteraeota bacterium]
MIHRIAAALFLCLSLAACKENDAGGDQKSLGQQFFLGQGDVKVIDAHVVPSGDASAQTGGGTLDYVIARVELTNDMGADLTPDISHFYMFDAANNRYQATDTGSSVFTGISNSAEVLKQGDKRQYTIGFRTNNPNITGTILYER